MASSINTTLAHLSYSSFECFHGKAPRSFNSASVVIRAPGSAVYVYLVAGVAYKQMNSMPISAQDISKQYINFSFKCHVFLDLFLIH